MLRRLSAILTAALLGTGLLAVPTGSATATANAPGSASAASVGAAVSSVTWTRCSDPELRFSGLQCGSLRVPLDHADPTGPTIRLALTRKPHTATPYQGVMLTNPGGPGGSGRGLASLGDSVPGNAGDSYDWIGFDPRGVGASSPSLHCTRSYFGYDRPRYESRTARLTRYWLAKNRRYSAACANTAGKRALLPHLTTLDTVRDMELVRQALGTEQLNYYGFSYGTYLGQLYATLHPSRVRRFVLDGVVNASRVWYTANLDQDRAFERTMAAFWHYLAAHPRVFRLGTHWRAIKRGYYRTLNRLDRHPSARGRLGPDELADVMLDAGYYVYHWIDLGLSYSDLVRHHRGAALAERYRLTERGDDNEFAVYNAVQCTDARWPAWVQVRRDSRALSRRAPFLTWGNTWYNGPCLSWHAPARARAAVSGGAVSAKVLLISETLDAATPYSGALATRRLFPSASLVAGVGGTTHASSLSGVSCVDNAVATYLRTGAVPTRRSGNRADRSCPRVRPPQPFIVSGRVTGRSDAMSPRVRAALLAAQR